MTDRCTARFSPGTAAAPEYPAVSYVYVASSWRCLMQEAVCHVLTAAGIEHYDFKNPEGGTGFSWKEVMPSFDIDNQAITKQEYLAGLQHPRSIEGFDADYAAMEKADTFILVLPCGRSAHLELGWATGQGKRTAILLSEEPVVPELMYRLADHLSPDIGDLLKWLGVPNE